MLSKEIVGENLGVVNQDQQRLIRTGRVQTAIIDHGSFALFRKAATKIEGFEVRVVAGSDQDMLTQGKSLLIREAAGRNGVPLLVRREEVLRVHVPEGKLGISIEKPIGKTFADFQRSLENAKREPRVKKLRR